MTKYIVRCITSGTGVNLAVSARNPHVAVDKAFRNRLGRKAACYVVVERKSGNPVHTAVNKFYTAHRG